MERRLAAILAADVVGYSRLMENDETGTLAALKAHRAELINPLIAEHGGRIVKLMGDGALAEFASVVDAVACAVAIQQGMVKRNDDMPKDMRIELRIGVNLGDIIIEGDDIYGDGVNVAARIETLAKPGGVALSGYAHDQVVGKVERVFEDLGERTLRNISRPVHVWRWPGSAPSGTAANDDVASLPLPDKPSIAVLPFTNMSGDPDQEYFADGITEDIITELSRFRSLFVIARHSCFTFKGKTAKAQDIGRELGVAYLVEGSVRKAGDRLRVNVQLVKSSSGEHVWAERYDRDLAEIFLLQDELIQTVATMIGGRVQAEDRRRATMARNVNVTAYDNVLRAQALYYQISRSPNAEARQLLESAIRLDPSYARAFSLLAASHNMDFMQSWSDEPERSLELALQYADRAVSLDDSDSLNHAHLGEILQNSRRFAEAERHFKKAVHLNPNDVEARALYGSFIGGESGLEQLEIAERLTPCDFEWIPWIKGGTCFELRQYDDAIECLSQVSSKITSARGWLAASLALVGRLDEAHKTLEEFLKAVRTDLPKCPQTPDEWAAYWRREGQFDTEEEFQVLCNGLRRAGLDI